jgi:glutathione S-transferase
MEKWISIEAANFTPGVMKILGQLLFARMRGEEPNMVDRRGGPQGGRKAVAVMEKQLAGQDYLAVHFSLADICFMPYVEYLFMTGRAR